MTNEYAAPDSSGGGERSAKPRGTYTAKISRAETKTDKNGLLYVKFGLSIITGKLAKQLAFENYLPLSAKANKFQVARRNSLFRAIGLDAGAIPPGAPGGPDVSVLNGTIVDFALEHTYEDVPGEDYALNTSKWNKSSWVTDGWEARLDANGNIPAGKDGTKATDEDGEPSPVKPSESITFYNMSDLFEGIGETSGDGDGFTPDDAAGDDDSWG